MHLLAESNAKGADAALFHFLAHDIESDSCFKICRVNHYSAKLQRNSLHTKLKAPGRPERFYYKRGIIAYFFTMRVARVMPSVVVIVRI